MKFLKPTKSFKPVKQLSFLNCIFLLQRGIEYKLPVYDRSILPFVPPINCYWELFELSGDTLNYWNPITHFKDIPLICFVMKAIADRKPATIASALEILLEYLETEEPLDLFLNLDSIFRLFYYSPSEEGLLTFKLFRRYRITNLLMTTPLPMRPKKQRRIFSGHYLEDRTTFKKRKKEVFKHRILGNKRGKQIASLLDYYMPIDISFIPYKIVNLTIDKKTKYEQFFRAYGRAK